MHLEAYAGFGWLLVESGLDLDRPWRVLDVGGQDVNGTVHGFFSPAAVITTLDLRNAQIIADATTWAPTRLFDLVISTETFEHVERWDLVVATMAAALDPAGPGLLLATCASTGREPHGMTGEATPPDGEWYGNVGVRALLDVLYRYFYRARVRYHRHGDAYIWAQGRIPAAQEYPREPRDGISGGLVG